MKKTLKVISWEQTFVQQDVTREVYAHKDLQEYLVLKFQESASLKNNLKYYEAGNDQLVSIDIQSHTTQRYSSYMY